MTEIVSGVVVRFERGKSLILRQLHIVVLGEKVAALPLELSQWAAKVGRPRPLIKFEQLNDASLGTLLEDAFRVRGCHQGHLVDYVLVHLHTEEITHLSVAWRNVLEERQVANDVLKLLAVFEIVHDNTETSLVLAGQLDAAVLDLVVVHDKRANLCLEQHAEG